MGKQGSAARTNEDEGSEMNARRTMVCAFRKLDYTSPNDVFRLIHRERRTQEMRSSAFFASSAGCGKLPSLA
jgi:hypothetical protein